MEPASRPLAIAAAATVLLIAVLAVDLTYNRSLSLELRQGEGWVTLGATGPADERTPHRMLRVDANETLQFRLRVDNDMPLAYEEPFRVYHHGTLVAEGTLEASATDVGSSTFTLNASTLTAPPAGAPATKQDVHFVNLEVDVGDERLFASFELREAEAS